MTARQFSDPVPPCVPAQIHPEGWRLCSDATDHEAAARAHYSRVDDLLDPMPEYLATVRLTIIPSDHQVDMAMGHLRQALHHIALQDKAGNG